MCIAETSFYIILITSIQCLNHYDVFIIKLDNALCYLIDMQTCIVNSTL